MQPPVLRQLPKSRETGKQYESFYPIVPVMINDLKTLSCKYSPYCYSAIPVSSLFFIKSVIPAENIQQNGSSPFLYFLLPFLKIHNLYKIISYILLYFAMIRNQSAKITKKLTKLTKSMKNPHCSIPEQCGFSVTR